MSGDTALLDPWCLVETAGGRLLFGYAVRHPETGGLAWLRSSSVEVFSAELRLARTESGRVYDLGRQVEPEELPKEGVEAWIAYQLLCGEYVGADDAVPDLMCDPHHDGNWLMACKMARHLGLALPPRDPVRVDAFLGMHGDEYLNKRQHMQ